MIHSSTIRSDLKKAILGSKEERELTTISKDLCGDDIELFGATGAFRLATLDFVIAKVNCDRLQLFQTDCTKAERLDLFNKAVDEIVLLYHIILREAMKII